jgi:hypothetical protein
LGPQPAESEKFIDVIQEGFNIDAKPAEKPKKDQKKKDVDK